MRLGLGNKVWLTAIVLLMVCNPSNISLADTQSGLSQQLPFSDTLINDHTETPLLTEQIKQHYFEEERKDTEALVAIIGAYFVVILMLFISNQKKEKQKQELEVQMKDEQYAHEMKQKALSGRLKKSNEALREAIKQRERHEMEQQIGDDTLFNSTGQERYEAFLQMPICQTILDRVALLHADKRIALKTNTDVTEFKSLALSHSERALLSKAVETSFPKLFDTLKNLYLNLDRKEWLYCCLYLMQLDKMSICVLLQESYHTCRRHTLKLEESFECHHELMVFLLEQAKAI